MTYDQTIAALAVVSTFFPHTFALSDPAMVDVWHRELEAYDAGDVDQAIRLLCRELTKFPTLKDIIDRLGPAEPGASEAWAAATAYASVWADGARWVGGQVLEPPGLSDPAIAAAVESVGGLRAVRSRGLDDEPAMRAHFFRRYEEARTKARRIESLTVINGGAPRAQLLEGATQALAEDLADVKRNVIRQANRPPGGGHAHG